MKHEVHSDVKNQNINILTQIYIVGKLDCPKISLCKQIVNELESRKIGNYKFEFVLAFETPFEFHVEELVKENLEFLEYKESPIIYIQHSDKKKEIIGSLREFLNYLIVNFGHYEERNESLFIDQTQNILKEYMRTNGNKFCFFDLSINNKSVGKVVFELFYNQLPKTCENFLSLCEGFRNEKGNKLWYKNTVIHRIVKNGYIQGGEITSSLKGTKSIYNTEFADESYNISHSYPGILGMVKKNNRKHSNECQFYITMTSMKAFDGLFVAFGRVIQGYNHLKAIENLKTSLQKPIDKINIDFCGIYQI